MCGPAYQIYLMGPSADPSTDDLCKKNILEAHCKSSSSQPYPSIDRFHHIAAAALNTNQGARAYRFSTAWVYCSSPCLHAFKEVFWVRVMVRAVNGEERLAEMLIFPSLFL
jgi:hypothetical protein